MKKVLSIILVCCLLISFCGCGEQKKAEKAVSEMFTALKKENLEKAVKYIADENFLYMEDETDEYANIIISNLLGNLKYKIISSEKIDENTVIVTAQITTPDIKPIMTEYFAWLWEYAFSAAFADPLPSEEEMSKAIGDKLIEFISKNDLSTQTSDVNIKVVKDKNNNWKIDADETLVNALFGGLSDFMYEIEDLFN